MNKDQLAQIIKTLDSIIGEITPVEFAKTFKTTPETALEILDMCKVNKLMKMSPHPEIELKHKFRVLKPITPENLLKFEDVLKKYPLILEPELIGIVKNKRIDKMRKEGKLWDHIVVDELNKKHVGDISAKEIVLISALGRLVKNKKPFSFNLLLHSASSSGKDHLIHNVLLLFPEKDIEAFGRISKTTLTYLHDAKKDPLWTYDGKILYLEEITEDILNNEVMKVFTAGLTRSAITKDQSAEIIEIKGKPVVICSTATTKPTPEILNRFSVVKLDESEEQTRRTYLSDNEDYDPNIRCYLRDLKPQIVEVPSDMRKKIAKYFPANKPQFRRAFPRFLDIMKAVAIFNNGHTREGQDVITTWKDYDRAVDIFRNYRSGVSSIPLRNEDKKIVEFLESREDPVSARDILIGIEGILSNRSIYRHLAHLTENEILTRFDQRNQFGSPEARYGISEDMKDKNPIILPRSDEMK